MTIRLANRVDRIAYRLADWLLGRGPWLRRQAECRDCTGIDGPAEGMHLSVDECDELRQQLLEEGCPNPAEHHEFRRRAWWAR